MVSRETLHLAGTTHEYDIDADGSGLTWLASDYLYYHVVSRRLAEWERSVERDEEGVRIGCREFTVGNGRHAMLMVHGFNDSPRVYDRMARVLANRGFTCRAMRLPGFGIPIRETLRYRKEDWLAATQAELEQLRERHEHVSVVGHSLGGAILVNVLARGPILPTGWSCLPQLSRYRIPEVRCSPRGPGMRLEVAPWFSRG
jgi:pimeloyl-ACP methyl ester carboxylesterase